MALQYRGDNPLVSMITCEMRFDDAYRYLDRCGNTISRIRNFDKQWVSTEPNPQTSALVHPGFGLSMSLGTERMNVSKNEDTWVKLGKARDVVENLADQVEPLYEIVTETIDIPNTTRIGVRFVFIAPTNSLEDSERALVMMPQSPLSDFILRMRNADLFGVSTRYRIEEPDTGYRRSINIFPVSRLKVGMQRPMGFSDDVASETGVSIDIDTYTRPASGHFQDTAMYIKKSFNSSYDIAFKIFEWLDKEGKRK